MLGFRSPEHERIPVRNHSMPGALAASALGLALLLTGGLFDAEPLLVGGVALVVLAAGASGWVALAARGARLEREVSAHRVVEEEPVIVELRATARAPLPGGAIVEPLLRSAASAVRPGARRAYARIALSFARRGRRVLEAPALVVRDPLGLARREVSGPAGELLLVLPRVEPVRVIEAPGRARGPAGRAVAGTVEGIDPDGLRPYRAGAPATRIHWPAYARGAGLLERHLAPDPDARPLIFLDPRAPAVAEDLDAAVRAAASLCLELARRGGCAILVPGERRARRLEADLGAWPAIWAALALVEATSAPAPAGLTTRSGPVVAVCARGGRPPATLLRGAGARLLVLPAGAAGPRGARPVLEVAGCRGYLLRIGRREAA
jgi:uncharacterized protein (DUF58 family)